MTKLTTKSGKEINIPTNDVETVDNVTFIGVKLECDPSYGYPTITSVTIPNGLTAIPNSAFEHCKSLPNITIPDSVKTIGDSAFFECNSLKSLMIGNSVTTIGQEAFLNCYLLTSVTIPDSVTTIGPFAFQNCSSLKSVTIGNSVTTIKVGAFYDCTNSDLSIDISSLSNITSIESMAFVNVNNINISETQKTFDNYPWGALNVNGEPTGY